MRVIEVDDMRSGYHAVVREVLERGLPASPRGMSTLELAPATVVIRDPSKVAVGVGRKLRLEIGAAESAHLLGGFSDAAQLVSITKNFEQFVEGGLLRGAYGPRAHAQFPRAVALLERDPDTRQAGVVLWRPWELAAPSADVPCTVHLQFMLRRGRLDMTVLMRSNDVYWGLPYDAWVFANAQVAVARSLRVDVGTYYHVASSLHAYLKDLESLGAVHEPKRWQDPVFPPMLGDVDIVGVPPASGSRSAGAVGRWEAISALARVAAGVGEGGVGRLEDFGPVPEQPAWYRMVLAPHMTGGSLCRACRYVVQPGALCGCFLEGR